MQKKCIKLLIPHQIKSTPFLWKTELTYWLWTTIWMAKLNTYNNVDHVIVISLATLKCYIKNMKNDWFFILNIAVAIEKSMKNNEKQIESVTF